MNIVKYRNFFVALGGIVMAVAIGLLVSQGLEFGIDFTGGSIMEVTFSEERPEIDETEAAVASVGAENVSVRPTGEDGYIIRTATLEQGQRPDILDELSALADSGSAGTSTAAVATSSDTATGTAAGVTQQRFSSIGPTVGSELTRSAIYGIIAVVVSIILFVTFAFRKVSKPVSSWVYGSVAIVSLIHDILVPTGVFVILGITVGAQVDLLFVMALLAILGYSVNDTIVVFDRIRENLQENYDKNSDKTFAETVGESLSQTYVRSINTSLTTFVVLLCLYLIGGDSTELFSLTLLVGVLAGTYSSIFLASPLLVKIQEWRTDTKETVS